MSNATFLGKVGMTPKGEWNNQTVYERLDVVSYQGSSYIALTQNRNSIPSDDNQDWMVGAKHGEFTEEQLEEFKAEVVRESKQEIDDFTQEQKQELEDYEDAKETELNTYTQDKKGEIDTHTTGKINAYNENAYQKETAYNNNATSKTNTFNSNANDKTTAYNENAASKTEAFDGNASNKTTAFNENASSKTESFDGNATSKTTAFNENATEKQGTFDINAASKTNTFNTNASNKTTAFNENATAKTNAFDEHTAEIQADITALENGKQDKINSSNKLASDLVDDTNQTNKFVTSSEKSTWNGKYTKPGGGIPKTDLAEAVQTSLGKADTAVQDVSDLEAEITELQQDNTNLLNALPSISGSGSNVVLEGTSKNKYKQAPLPEGNSTQTQLTGKNLASDKFASYTIGNVYAYMKLIEEFSGTSMLLSIIDANTSIDISGVYFGFTANGASASGGALWLITDGTVRSEMKLSTSSYKYLSFYPNDEETFNKIFSRFKVQVELSNSMTATSYEPYCGGTASPNPTYKQDIHNVSGDVEVLVQNKNLFNPNGEFENGYYNTDGTFTSSTGWKCMTVNCNAGDKFVKSGSRWGGNVTFWNNDTFVSAINAASVTIPSGVTKVKFACQHPFYGDEQLELGSTATSYTPHEEQTLPFTLASGQKMYLGSYLADDGIHHVRNINVYRGANDEGWSMYSNGGVTNRRFINTINDMKVGTSNNQYNVLSNRFKQGGSNSDDNFIITHANSGMIWVGSTQIEDLDLAGFKAWLAENPLEIEYPLATEVVIPYNSTQQAQYNAIKKAISYKDTTVITLTSDDADPLTNVVAVADMSNFDLNDIDEIKTAIVALGGVI